MKLYRTVTRNDYERLSLSDLGSRFWVREKEAFDDFSNHNLDVVEDSAVRLVTITIDAAPPQGGDRFVPLDEGGWEVDLRREDILQVADVDTGEIVFDRDPE